MQSKISNESEDYVLCKYMVEGSVSKDRFEIKSKKKNKTQHAFSLFLSLHIYNLACIYSSQRLCFAKWVKHINPDIYYHFVCEVGQLNLSIFHLTVTLIILTICNLFASKVEWQLIILKISHRIKKILST